MKNLLIIAPGFTAPWTEGRKNFIRDLIPYFKQHVNLGILNANVGWQKIDSFLGPVTNYSHSAEKSIQLLSLYFSLKRLLKSSDRPDIIVHFPYGSFGGVRGVANYLSIAKTHQLINDYGIPCLTVLYSMAGGDLQHLCEKIPNLATVKSKDWPGHVVNVGININIENNLEIVKNDKKLLFIAGYQENKASLLNSILHDRGLIDIIDIGEQLAENGFCLTISIPLLKHKKLRNELLSLLQKKAPSLPVKLEHEVNVYDSFSRNNLFIFPFRKNYNVFVSTSVLEAMSSGIPVIISNLPMFIPLIGTKNLFCGSYIAGEPSRLLEAILHACENWDETIAKSKEAKEHVAKNWSIEKSAFQLMELVDEMTK